MGLKIIENFDANFILTPEAKETLFNLLKNPEFVKQISQQLSNSKASIQFTELIFQPVPYSTQTPKGMPPEFEKYHHSDEHIIINIPPNFMFKAKIFKPSRLCTIYRLIK
ncbi:conserved hypothetical protein [Crocosphaera subtropica ATCC 51142]|uniref:Uncharacterized protein n=1 Tax=Crocosphaera subtropica (strain ATCC 51142 / BH68) TaxID=43989 RepID=B1WU07_CROS5|nr:hypothetical protein [Crocosphaera subtropica]ACB52069.1 conserved hypothetical protein [Crocosphaera subtropica ATCC 51142]